MTKIKLVIIEDNKVVGESLSQFFEPKTNIDFISLWRSIEDFQQAHLAQDAFDIMLLDINLPGMNGIQAIPFIHEKHPSVDIIMLTTFDDADHIFNALKAGACSYLSKRSSLEKIHEAIEIVSKGGSFMSPSIARKVVGSFNHTKADEFEDITARQKQIIEGLVDGQSYQQIADANHISVETVRDHIKKIYRKLQINSRNELIKISYKNKWR
jgi:DNA-binding NarL/FixJ family response regulator